MLVEKHNQRIVALGGTFDQLHKGHRKIITKALQIGDKIILGLTSDGFISARKKGHSVSSYQFRCANLEHYLSSIGALERVEIVSLEDPYGPTISNESISAIVVSRATLRTAFEINKIRVDRGMTSIQVYAVDYVYAENGKPISTSRVSQGLITKEGKLLRSGPVHEL